MIVSIGMNILPGAWGGGNQFGRSLTAYLRSHDVHVEYDLTRKDIDIILLTEPRGALRNCAFTDDDIRRYCRAVNPFANVVHRVNECDERKGTTGVNARLRDANTCAHHTVFVSAWLRDLHVAQGMKPESHSVIHDGADTWTFHSRGYLPWRGQGPLRLVTHHWDASPYKGADTYLQVDRLLAEPRYSRMLDFTFIGNLPNGVRLRHATALPPMHGQDLADTIRSHHVYLTGAQYEPAGMHHIEGACCGLPLLFRKSGALPEYCADYGLGFTGPDFEQVVAAMVATYHVWTDRIRTYPFTAERMCAGYLELFQRLMAQRAHAAYGARSAQ